MHAIKAIAKKLLGKKILEIIRKFKIKRNLRRTFLIDFKLFKNHSSIFRKDTFNKIESEITLRYHSIEKGFLHDPIRFRFAKSKVEELLNYLQLKEIENHIQDVQIQSAIINLCAYYELHSDNNINISDFFTKKKYEEIKEKIITNYKPVKNQTSDKYFKFSQSSFDKFSTSRCSVRDFTGQKIPIDVLQKVVNLANQAPTVCNRQGISVNLLDNKEVLNEILLIQGGLKGYSDKISQLIALTCDRNYFYSIGERYQMYIDGGIYLMNLLYALHFYEVVACPAHWGMPVEADVKAQKLLRLNESEKIICIIAIGKPRIKFKTTLSLRRSYNENLRVIN